jgi:hypothetical protein
MIEPCHETVMNIVKYKGKEVLNEVNIVRLCVCVCVRGVSF